MNKTYSCLSVSATPIQSRQKNFHSAVSSCCFFSLLQNVLHAMWKKYRIFPKWKDVEGRRELGFLLPSTHQKQTDLKILALPGSFMGAELIAEWENRQTPAFTLKKPITLIQEQDHFRFLFPKWSFPQSKSYLAPGFPSAFV